MSATANDDAALYKYSGTVASLIDACALPSNAARPEVSFLRARVERGASVLDIGAGAGALAVQLAAAGHPVTALEPDAGMYGVLLGRLAALPADFSRVTPVPRAIGFDLGASFDAGFALAVVHHLDPAERATLFRYAAAHLRPGGIFIVDAPVESAARAEMAHQLRSERVYGTTRLQHWHSMRRAAPGRWQTVWEFVTLRGSDELERRQRVFDWSVASRDEIGTLADGAGLRVDEWLGDFDGTSFDAATCRTLVAVMRRAE